MYSYTAYKHSSAAWQTAIPQVDRLSAVCLIVWYMTPLLICLAAILVLVVAVCLAMRFCNLDQVNLHANVLKLANVSFSVKSRPPREDVRAESRVPKKRRR